jgi:hypothetical protein
MQIPETPQAEMRHSRKNQAGCEIDPVVQIDVQVSEIGAELRQHFQMVLQGG